MFQLPGLSAHLAPNHTVILTSALLFSYVLVVYPNSNIAIPINLVHARYTNIKVFVLITLFNLHENSNAYLVYIPRGIPNW